MVVHVAVIVRPTISFVYWERSSACRIKWISPLLFMGLYTRSKRLTQEKKESALSEAHNRSSCMVACKGHVCVHTTRSKWLSSWLVLRLANLSPLVVVTGCNGGPTSPNIYTYWCMVVHLCIQIYYQTCHLFPICKTPLYYSLRSIQMLRFLLMH
jgi:hypothetical protein